MSLKENDSYLENKQYQFEEILEQKRWDLISPFYQKMEEDGMGEFVPQISELMSDEDVREYKEWDVKTNGSIEVKMDDNS